METKSALIVEDNKDLQRIFSVMFRKYGYAVTAIDDGVNAMTYLDTATPNVVILDVNLPRASGLDVLLHLRKRHGSDTKVIMVTADYRAEQSHIAEQADLFLIKPVNTKDLIALADRLTATV